MEESGVTPLFIQSSALTPSPLKEVNLVTATRDPHAASQWGKCRSEMLSGMGINKVQTQSFWGKICLIFLIICHNAFFWVGVKWRECFHAIHLFIYLCTPLRFIILKSTYILISAHKWHAPYIEVSWDLFIFLICEPCLDELHESSLVLKHLSLRINSNPWISSSVCADTFDVHMLLCLIHPPKWQ